MQRFNDSYFLGPNHRQRYERRRPHNNSEIRIPVRRNGHPIRKTTGGSPKQGDGNEHQRPVPEATVPKPSPTQAQPEQIKTLTAEWKEKYTRLYAERENERKRLERNFANQADLEKERVLRDMLPLADNLERALAHAADKEIGLQEGVTLTLKAFADALAKHGVERIEAEGQPFDPNLHEAVGAIPHPTLPSGIVIRVEETGYAIQGKLLRPARVLVTA